MYVYDIIYITNCILQRFPGKQMYKYILYFTALFVFMVTLIVQYFSNLIQLKIE